MSHWFIIQLSDTLECGADLFGPYSTRDDALSSIEEFDGPLTEVPNVYEKYYVGDSGDRYLLKHVSIGG